MDLFSAQNYIIFLGREERIARIQLSKVVYPNFIHFLNKLIVLKMSSSEIFIIKDLNGPEYQSHVHWMKAEEVSYETNEF